jgi:hypothetical protein
VGRSTTRNLAQLASYPSHLKAIENMRAVIVWTQIVNGKYIYREREYIKWENFIPAVQIKANPNGDFNFLFLRVAPHPECFE